MIFLETNKNVFFLLFKKEEHDEKNRRFHNLLLTFHNRRLLQVGGWRKDTTAGLPRSN